METTFKIPAIRHGHQVTIADTSCFWFEMDRPEESPRELLSIFDLYLNQYNWDKFITPGMTVVDIGGHSGDTAIPMQFLSRSTVLSIEPNPAIKEYLDFACRMNSHLGKFVTAGEAVTIEDCAEVEILDHCNALCNGGLVDPTWSAELQQRMRNMSTAKVTVPGLKLENLLNKYLTEEEIANIGFIKTDTEGHDVSILESSADLLDKLRPVIFTEWFFAYTDVESRRMFDVIEQIGYKPFYPTTLTPATIDQRSDDLVLIHTSQIDKFL